MLPTCVDGDLAAEDLGRSVALVRVEERTAAGQREPADLRVALERRRVLVVTPPDLKLHPVSPRDDDAGWPDLDVELVDLAGRERLSLVVRVVRPPFFRALRVEFAVRRPQPALRDRRVRVDRPLEDDLLALRVEHADRQE